MQMKRPAHIGLQNMCIFIQVSSKKI